MLKDQDGDVFYDKLRLIFLQMPLFTKTESELSTHRDKWLYFLKHLASFDDIPAILNEPVFERAFETAELARMNAGERARYEASLKIYRDNYAVLETARMEGKEEGKEEGRAEEKVGIARNMKNGGFDSEVISKMTGLSKDEIEQLK